ncbi:hypothetical protein, partial [Escherichia coli]|uniref:hypothetical protein n=1 Tax=Escherichia coli TaxID=562 RepID=UPI00201A9C27
MPATDPEVDVRVLLRPVLVPELGLVIVKPGRDSMSALKTATALLGPEPKNTPTLPARVITAL